MRQLDSDIHAICTRIETCLDAIADDGNPPGPVSEGAVDPRVLRDALTKYVEVLRQADPGHGTDPALAARDVTELGDYGIALLGDLVEQAGAAGLAGPAAELRWLAPELGLWIARHGGELRSLELMVDTLALAANGEHKLEHLRSLSGALSEIVAAVADDIRADTDRSNPGRPWRVLLLNHCIVATRAHSTDLMRAAYDLLIKYLPEDAPGFFREGMQQMETIDYPEHVREVVREYFDEWNTETLH